MARIHIGISGWTFDGWRGNFYPDGLKQKDELAYASRRVRSIEVNGTFYGLLKPPAFRTWAEQTPPDFVFTMKGPKYITHVRRLKEFETPLANFLASGILGLGPKLGPILWQFPPTLPFTVERFAPFMAALPHDAARAAEIGKAHSPWLTGRTMLEPDGNFRLRHAMEGRHASFKAPEFVALARQHGIAIVVGDTAGRWPLIEDVTADFVYLRLHGDETVFPDGYTKAALERWALRFGVWSRGGQPDDAALVVPAASISTVPRQVFAYFDNDTKETAPLDAVSMITRLVQLGLMEERPIADLPAPMAAKAKKTAVGAGATAATAAKPEKAAKPGKAAKPEKAAKPGKAAKPEKAAKREDAAKPTRAAKPNKAAKANQPVDQESAAGQPGRARRARPAAVRGAKRHPARP